MKVTQYNAITQSDLVMLVEQVNKAIREGWQPLGGISIATDREGEEDSYNTLWFAQAMVRTDVVPKNPVYLEDEGQGVPGPYRPV